MARDSDTIFLSNNIWALTGDRTAPSFPENTGWGSTYEQDPDLGGTLIERENMNQNFYKLSLLSNLITTYGASLEWDATIPYVQGAIVVGNDGKPYSAKQANSNQDPTTDTLNTYWINLTGLDALQISYLNIDGSLTDNLSTSLDRLQFFLNGVGQVKINDGNGVQPSTSQTTPSAGTPSTEQLFNYALPLTLASAPTTHWPLMESAPSDAGIWDDTNSTFLENFMLGQTHTWRFVFSFNKPSSPTAKFDLRIRLYNALSGFELTQKIYISEEISSGEFSFEFLTIADDASLPPPFGSGQGYNLASSIIGDSGSVCDVTLVSTTRYSSFNTYTS